MSEMVERVARALATHAQSHTKWEDCAASFREQKRADARAAILAMREPTDGMINAADPHGIIVANFEDAWHAMVDEALK